MKRWMAGILMLAMLCSVAALGEEDASTLVTYDGEAYYGDNAYVSDCTPLTGASDGELANVENAVAALSGWYIPYGTSFSFNDTVGPRTAENGFVEAINGRGSYAMGGGVARVATTLYLTLLQVDGVQFDEITCYGDRFTGNYVTDGALAVVTDYASGRDFAFTNYVEDMMLNFWIEGDELWCEVEFMQADQGASVEDGRVCVASACLELHGASGLQANVLRAASSVDGYVLESGDSFSFNAIVGPRTAANGYVQAVNGRGVRVVGGGVAFFVLLILFGLFLTRNDPSTGYYSYQDSCYYYSSRDYNGLNWFYYDADQDTWEGPLYSAQVPEALETKKKSKAYFIASQWEQEMPCDDFSSSVYAQDLETRLHTQEGYFLWDDIYYYHLSDVYDGNWYRYDGQWKAAGFSSLPDQLQHPSLAKNCFVSLEYPGSCGISDFSETLFYRDYNASQRISRGYYRVDDDVLYHLGDYYFDGWYTYDYDDDTWRSIDMDAVPEPLHHPSMAEDFYFTPTWDASTQFSDFEDTDAYKKDSKQWNNDDDDSYHWDSNDSWDSGDTDWDSDW